jgi:hypothetical protein
MYLDEIRSQLLIEKDKIMLFGLTECLADKDIAFAKKIAKKIKCKALIHIFILFIGWFVVSC